MVQSPFLHMLTLVAALALGGAPAVSAQQTSAPPAAAAAPGHGSQPQLPDAPRAKSPLVQPTEITEHAFSSSSPPSSTPATPPRFWTSKDPDAQVTVLENTLFRVRTNEPLSTRQTRPGVPLLFTLSEDVVVNGVLIIPRGAMIHGTVMQSQSAGTLTGAPGLILKLTSLDLSGHNYPLYTYQFRVTGASKSCPTATKIKGGAVIGAVVGGIFSGSAKGNTTAVGKLAGMGTGAALGAGMGTVVAAATPGPILSLPAESQMDFYLAAPISVVPVSVQEAARLSQGLHPGGPLLYVRGETP